MPFYHGWVVQILVFVSMPWNNIQVVGAVIIRSLESLFYASAKRQTVNSIQTRRQIIASVQCKKKEKKKW